MHPRAVDFAFHVLEDSQVVLEFRHTHAVVVIFLLEELQRLLFRGIRIGEQRKFYNHGIVNERRRDGIRNRAHFGIALLHHHHLHHLRKFVLLAGGLVRTPEQVDQRRILAQIHEQVHLAAQQRLDVVSLREQQVVNAHQFLLVLHGLEEEAVIVQELHVLIFRGIQGEHKVLARRIGDARLQVEVRHRLELRDSLFALEGIRLLRDGERDGIRPDRKHLLRHLERKVAVARVIAPRKHPHGIGLVLEPAQFHVHRLYKGGMRRIEVSRGHAQVFALRLFRSLCRSSVYVLFRRRRTARHEHSAKESTKRGIQPHRNQSATIKSILVSGFR